MSGAWWAFVPSGVGIALVAFALALDQLRRRRDTNPRLRDHAPPTCHAGRRNGGTRPSATTRVSAERSRARGRRPLVEYRGERPIVRAVDDVSASASAPARSSGSPASPAAASRTIAHCDHAPAPRPGRDHRAARSGSRTGTSWRMGAAELRAFRWRQVAMVFQCAMNALNPVMTVGDQIVDVFTTHERLSEGRAASAGRGAARARPHRPGPPALLPAPALGRDAPARRHRDGAGAATRPAHHGRAHDRARRGRAAGDHGADRRAAAASSGSRCSSSPTTCR